MDDVPDSFPNSLVASDSSVEKTSEWWEGPLPGQLLLKDGASLPKYFPVDSQHFPGGQRTSEVFMVRNRGNAEVVAIVDYSALESDEEVTRQMIDNLKDDYH